MFVILQSLTKGSKRMQEKHCDIVLIYKFAKF